MRRQVFYFKRIYTFSLQCFWNKIGKLGPTRRNKVPMEVIGPNNRQVTEPAEVISRWEKDFKGLLSTSSFDDTFYQKNLSKPYKRSY